MDVSEIIKYGPDYAILRKSNTFPIVNRGSDIDILVKDIPEWLDYLHTIIRRYPGKLVSYELGSHHSQADYYEDGFYLKFDLYSRYISQLFTDDVFKSVCLDGEFLVAHAPMNRLSKCYEHHKYGKSKYCEYEKYFKDLSKYL